MIPLCIHVIGAPSISGRVRGCHLIAEYNYGGRGALRFKQRREDRSSHVPSNTLTMIRSGGGMHVYVCGGAEAHCTFNSRTTL